MQLEEQEPAGHLPDTFGIEGAGGAVIVDGVSYLRNDKGHLVPESMVSDADRLQDQMVRKILGYAIDLSAQIARFRGHCFDDVGAFMGLLAERYGASRGGAKGNVQFLSYDGCTKVVIQVADRMSFGPELQIAKSLIDECIAEWSEGSRVEIRTLIAGAFDADKEGKVNTREIFKVRDLEIDDPRWRSVQAAITESIRIIGSKTYIRFFRRDDPTADWEPVTINLAKA